MVMVSGVFLVFSNIKTKTPTAAIVQKAFFKDFSVFLLMILTLRPLGVGSRSMYLSCNKSKLVNMIHKIISSDLICCALAPGTGFEPAT